MTNWKELEKQFTARLSLDRRPVAVTFLDAEPAGVPKFSGTEPAGCSFWRLAAAGRAFYTVPADHFNCAVGLTRTTCSFRPIVRKKRRRCWA